MSVYENDIPLTRSNSAPWRTIRAKITKLVQTMQYSRMVSVMAQLTDEQLAQAGIQRKDIPARCRECIYGTPWNAPKNGA